MSKLICVVHYEHLGVCNEPLKLLNEETFKKLVESKDARCTLGASYFHKEQIESLPQCFDSDKHGFHRQCYQKFTNAVSVLKRKSSIADVSEKRQRRSGQFGSVLFPKICMKCKSSNYITVKGKKQQPKNLTTLSACEQVKKAATLQHDEVMLLIVANEDLIAREFKMHERCYRDYTRICTKETAQTSTAASNNDDDDSDSRFQRLCEFVEHHVIDGEQSVSIKLLTEVYGLDQEDCRLRGKVKQKLMQEFEDKLLFVTVLNNEAQVVLSKNVLTNTKKSSFFESNRDFAMKEAAKIIRNDVVSLIQSASDLPWPPTVQSLLSEDRHPPESLTNFLTCLLHSTEHSVGEEVRRHVDSLSQDIIYGISKRKFLTGKHVLLGCGLHSLTGLKKPINILARLGHCCSYNKVQEIETAQAELAQKMISLQHPLPLIPVDHAGKAPTIFWWDNFDCKKETKDGSIHTCHGVAFQEDSDRCMKRDETLEVPVSKKRTVSVVPQVLRKVKVVPHKEPPPFDSFSTCEYNDENARQILLCWKFLRRSYSESTQEIARFVGWVTACFARKNSQSTHITFLPPIRKPITDYSTVLECIIQSQRLASVSNMKYTHITVDAGAAAKFYHIIWNNPKDFENVLIHLGDFHGMMEFFSVIGKIIKGSGFEEIVYQAGLCTSGGINGVLTGKHYNRSWMVHECFAEGIERLFWESFVDGLPRDLESHLRDIKTDQDCRNIIATSSFQEDRSIKNSERGLRGNSDKFVIRNGDVRVPSDFNKFLRNGDNKERMFQLIEEVWIQNAAQLGERTVFFARGSTCVKITPVGSIAIGELETDHEEADTKIAYLIKHAARSNNAPTCAMLEEFLENLYREMSSDPMWVAALEEQWDDAKIATERTIMSKIYKAAFYPNGMQDIQNDKIFHEHILRLSKTITVNHAMLQIPKVLQKEAPWPSAQTELLMINAYKTPADKLNCIHRCCIAIMNLLSMATPSQTSGADEFVPVLVYVLIRANPPNLLSTKQYINNFFDNRFSGEEMYCWTQFCAATEFVKSIKS
eukprot:Seg1960.8 transcript_id=Seg1960.8/GoldUCD/mRNA.D3Y31 product="GTPase-activating protein and VPS9 domain-containing protein 1" protein_id=Seg1960.8/GoldUCD/D3Y31